MPDEWIEKFLKALASSPNVTEAANACGIERSTAYRRRNLDPDFAARWDDAIQQSTDKLVGEMYRRAVTGTEKPVFYLGNECGCIREYSDTLAIFLAKAHRPEVYREVVKQEIGAADGSAVLLAFSAHVDRIYGDRADQSPGLDD